MPQAESYYYFAEQTSPDPKDMVINFDVKKVGDVSWVEFDTCLHVFDVMGRNPRQYLGDNIMECMNADKIQAQLNNHGWYGEQDHPFAAIDGQKLSRKRVTTIYMPNRSHKIINPRREGNKLNAHIQTASGTEAGRGMAAEIIQGLIPAFSCRCFGGLRIIDRKPTVIANFIVTYDWVLYPSFADAKMTNSPKIGTASLPITESAESKTFSQDVCIPWEELAVDISEKDQTISAFLESYQMDSSDIIGFANNGAHAVIQASPDLYIYAGISSENASRVKDFYRSLKIGG